MKLITTSWDDGHPLDFKLAELLHAYNMAATFYIPKSNAERKTMSAHRIQQLSKSFEIGGHTLHHTRLNSKNKKEAAKEIYGSFLWLEDLLGYKPVSFCFPGGVYDAAIIAEVFESGYQVMRTTELLCTKHNEMVQLLPTTLQMYEHSFFTYAKHLIKRKRFTSFIKLLASNSAYDILTLTENYMKEIPDGGFFHLWGHSWEIEKYNLWNKLEVVLSLIANREDCIYVENGSMLNYLQHQQQNKIVNPFL